MPHDTKKQALKRLQIAKGHLEKVIKMLEENSYCPDVIHQSQAVQAALKRTDELVLEGHLSHCVLGEMPTSKDKKEKLTQEILEVFKKQS